MTNKTTAALEALDRFIDVWPEDALKPVQSLAVLDERMVFPVEKLIAGGCADDFKQYISREVIEAFFASGDMVMVPRDKLISLRDRVKRVEDNSEESWMLLSDDGRRYASEEINSLIEAAKTNEQIGEGE